ncbi:MAG: hypothetical protein AAF826_06190 [Pseudomonadota bacterium]
MKNVKKLTNSSRLKSLTGCLQIRNARRRSASEAHRAHESARPSRRAGRFALLTRPRTVALLAFSMIATPSFAQVVPFDDTETYEVAKIADKGVCFAATKTLSENKRPMVYTYYHTVTDQRWHVLGYEINDTIDGDNVSLAVNIDGETTLLRDTLTQNSDFMLPFENIDEISKHETLSTTGDVMTVSIAETNDSVDIALEPFRVALQMMQACLTSFNESAN